MVCTQVIDAQVNNSLNNILAQYRKKFNKLQIDSIKNEAKMTIKAILTQLIDALCQSNSEKWFSILGS